MGTRIILKEVRLSFPKLRVAEEAQPGGSKRYGGVALVKPGSENDKIIQAAILKELKEAFKDKAELMRKTLSGDSGKYCYRDGALPTSTGKTYPEYEGHWVLSCNRREADGAPKVVDRDKTPLVQGSGRPYAGCYVNISAEIWVQKGQHTGVRCALIAVQFVRDGDAFASTPATDEDFEDITDYGETPSDSSEFF